MKTYNRALDFMALAAVQFTKGRPQVAAKLMVKATASSDFAQAIAIIEASNGQAFAAKEAEKARLAAAAKKVAAKKKVKASEEDEALESLVGDLDELDTDAGDAVEDEVELDEVEASDETDEEEDAGDDEVEAPSEAFASALASMVKRAAK